MTNDTPTPLPLDAVVLAAGEGSRMRSSRPKPIHRLCGRPMLQYVVDSLAHASAQHVVIVIGHRGDWVAKTMRELVDDVDLSFVEQVDQEAHERHIVDALTSRRPAAVPTVPRL